MASRRQKKKVAKRKQLQRQINQLKNLGEKQQNQNINIRKYTQKELKRLQNLTGIRSAGEYEKAVNRARSTPRIFEETRASKIGSYYKQDLIQRYYDLIDAGYITSKLTPQEVYDMAPQIIEDTTDEEELQKMVAEGERKMEEARARNLKAREKNIVVFDF